MKSFLNTYNKSEAKNSIVNNTKLTFVTWIKMTFLREQIIIQNFNFARLTQTAIKIMNYYTRTIALIILMFSGHLVSLAQDYSNPDSTATDPFAIDTTSSFYESGLTDDASKPVKKPYIRYVVPYDTISELVTYTAVVTWENDDNVPQVDSLYFRSKRWIKHEFKGTKKQVIRKDDKKEFKIVMEGEFPLIIEANKFSKAQNGKIVFDMELRFKEGRYKYKINNLVHVVDPPPGQENETRTYFEF